MAKKITFTPNHKPDPFHFVLSTRGKSMPGSKLPELFYLLQSTNLPLFIEHK